MDETKSFMTEIARSLNISRYKNESDERYYFRVVYSALGFWLRTLTVSSEYNNKGYEEWVSKAYLHRRLQNVLDKYIEIESKLKRDIFISDQFDGLNFIRSVLLRATDIIEVGFDSRVLNGNIEEWNVSTENAIVKGSLEIPLTGRATGLSWTIKRRFQEIDTNDIFMRFNIPVKPVSSLLKESISKANWEMVNDLTRFEFFDAEKKRIFSGCWVDSLKSIKNEMTIARNISAVGTYNYCLLKREDDNYMVSYFSEYEQNVEIRDSQRLLYALKAKSTGKLPVRIKHFKNYSIYRFGSRLPVAENYLLHYIGWPLENIANKKEEFVVTTECCCLVDKIIKNLEMDVEVTQDE